jgi:hypothetical protein
MAAARVMDRKEVDGRGGGFKNFYFSHQTILPPPVGFSVRAGERVQSRTMRWAWLFHGRRDRIS